MNGKKKLCSSIVSCGTKCLQKCIHFQYSVLYDIQKTYYLIKFI